MEIKWVNIFKALEQSLAHGTCPKIFFIIIIIIIKFILKAHIVKAMVFPVVTYGCDSWTIKKAEHWRIDAFELWCWRRLLRVPRISRSNQSILKEINPEYSLEGQMLKLMLQYFGHLMQITDSLEKTLILGKTEGKRRQRQKMRWLDNITDSMDMNFSKLQEVAWQGAIHGVTKSWIQLSDRRTSSSSLNLTFTCPHNFYVYRPLVFNQGWSYSLGDIWQCLETFLIVTTGVVVDNYGVEDKDAAKHPTVYRPEPST